MFMVTENETENFNRELVSLSESTDCKASCL